MSRNAIKITVIAFILSLAFFSISCSKKQETQKRSPKLETSREFPVLLEKAELRNLNEYIKVTGTLEGKNDIVLISETSGKIIEMYKKLGEWVDKGTALGRVDNSDYESSLKQAKASLIAAEASYESADLSFKSSEELFKEKKISQGDYNNAKSAFKNAYANLEGAKARVEQARKAFENSQFTAPVSGQIVDLPVQTGQTITQGTKIAGIVNTKSLIIKTGVGESYIRSIKQNSPVDIYYQNDEKSYQGVISGVGLKPISGTANYPVEISLAGTHSLLPGMVIEAKILSKTYKNVIYTSLNNIIQEYDKSYIFIVDEKDIAQRREVILGSKVNENVIITSGVKAGERIVYEGLENLETGTKVTVRN